MDCNKLQSLLSSLYSCEKTDEGLRIATTCLYPSFNIVHVYISSYGNGFRVHDGGGAYNDTWVHGRDEPLIRKMVNREAQRFHLKAENCVLSAEAISGDWLPSVLLSVANASSIAAHAVIDHVVAAAEAALTEKIYVALKATFPEPSINREYPIIGQSGKTHEFDFAVGKVDEHILLLQAVSPHHSSIAHKYTSFADVKASLNDASSRFAVFEKRLEPDDASLMTQVADLVPLVSLSAGAKRAMRMNR